MDELDDIFADVVSSGEDPTCYVEVETNGINWRRKGSRCVCEDDSWKNVVDNPQAYSMQTEFMKKYGLNEREFKLISTLSTDSRFPTVREIPYQAYKLSDYSNFDLFALANSDIKWYTADGDVVCFGVPSLGIPYITEKEFSDMTCGGGTKYQVWRVDVKVDGETRPIVHCSNGDHYMFSSSGFSFGKVRGYDGDMLEYKNGVYYGFGPCRQLRVDDRICKYVDIYTLEIVDDTEGVVVHYELLCGKVARNPTIDVLCDAHGKCYDSDGVYQITISEKEYFGKLVSVFLNGIVECERKDKNIPNSTATCERARNSVSFEKFMAGVGAPFRITSFSVPDKTEKFESVGGTRVLSLRTPADLKDAVDVVERSGVDENVKEWKSVQFRKIFRRYVSDGRYRSTKFIHDLRRKGISPDYECLERYLMWRGLYRHRNEWKFRRLKIASRCCRVYTYTEICTCHWVYDRAKGT
jgi:hypothetical protein